MMRISGDPSDADYIGDHAVAIIFGREFWTGGPVIDADETTGVIQYYVTDQDGNYLMDRERGCWRVARAVGYVRIFVDPKRC